jgi:hypothetical protein
LLPVQDVRNLEKMDDAYSVESELKELSVQLIGGLAALLPTLKTTADFDVHVDGLLVRVSGALERATAILVAMKAEDGPQKRQEKAAPEALVGRSAEAVGRAVVQSVAKPPPVHRAVVNQGGRGGARAAETPGRTGPRASKANVQKK